MSEKIVTSLRLITGPTSEPITLEQARLHLRLDATGSPETHPDDTIVEALIATAREHLDGNDGILGRCLMTQTWELVMDQFPWSEMKIPLPPLQSISSIKYDDLDGVEQTISSSSYIVDNVAKNKPGWVVPVATYTWPATMDKINAVRVRFVAGHGIATQIPAPIMQAMYLLIGHWYGSREQVTPVNLSSIPMGVDALLANYRTMGFGG